MYSGGLCFVISGGWWRLDFLTSSFIIQDYKLESCKMNDKVKFNIDSITPEQLRRYLIAKNIIKDDSALT